MVARVVDRKAYMKMVGYYFKDSKAHKVYKKKSTKDTKRRSKVSKTRR